jgi:hypothetical protein
MTFFYFQLVKNKCLMNHVVATVVFIKKLGMQSKDYKLLKVNE